MTEQKRITLIVSDLHMGNGKSGDDFVDHTKQFPRFLREQRATTEGDAGQIELIINGDFFEFVQVCPEAYALDSPEFWCSEAESLKKVQHILDGHPEVMAELKAFQEKGNTVTLFAGNHDVDFYWPSVQSRVRDVAGGVKFELEKVWFDRYDGRLKISHGHLFPSLDPVNGFKNWSNPRLKQPDDKLPPRLEMCAGTLFVIKYVNKLEKDYPFADNLHPELALADILLREDRWGLATVGWLLVKFAAQYRSQALDTGAKGDFDYAAHLSQSVKALPALRTEIAALYRDVLGEASVKPDDVAARLKTADAAEAFIEALYRSNGPPERWLATLDTIRPQVLGEEAGTLGLARTSRIDVPAECLKIARGGWKAGAEIVVLGHTHLPETREEKGCRYYNPGSWTRYVDAAAHDTLRLEDLRNEEAYPYRLNYVRVEDTGGTLKSEMICFEESPTRD
jgi:UDP-2,3-diacylglucosamine pyrophosphatase LpxH